MIKNNVDIGKVVMNMWVVFLLSAVGFAIGALILFSIGWLVIHKIEMHINRQDDDYENEKENKKKEDKE
jgi:membrane protein DedA with SNARE-associated domain|nr:MAG TPA: SNARE associated Golgi protein [Caudoviricetes sp.]